MISIPLVASFRAGVVRRALGGLASSCGMHPYWNSQMKVQRSPLGSRLLSSPTSSTTLSSTPPLILHPAPHKSVTIDPDSLPPPSDQSLQSLIEKTLEDLRANSTSACWVRLPISHTPYIPTFDAVGFSLHHATPTHAAMYIWLGKGENKVPEYATHQVGVGGVVVNDEGKILVVRELGRNYAKYKLPGGLADLGEGLDEAIEREVLEETGVAAKFQTVLSFRHTHGMQFGRSDLYFVCRLKPVDGSQIPVPQAGEIESAKWVPLGEYVDLVSEGGETPHPVMRRVLDVVTMSDGELDVQKDLIPSIVPGRNPSPVYHAALRK